MFPTKVMVAPNSPRLRLKVSTMPVSMPGKERGKVTVTNAQIGCAPNVKAACSSRGSTASMDKRTARTINGKAIVAEAITAPFQVNATEIPSVSFNHRPITPSLPRRSSKRNPGTTGGKTKGKCTRLSRRDLPTNRFRASSHAMAIPGTAESAVAQRATYKDRDSADNSVGVGCKNCSSMDKTVGNYSHHPLKFLPTDTPLFQR
jgi:hypothetical protein